MIAIFLHEERLDNNGIIIGKNESELRLLDHGLHEAGLLPPGTSLSGDDLSRTAEGKPFLPGFPTACFNFSHSGKYLALAVSDAKVGLDLQEEKLGNTDPLEIAKRFFTKDECRALLSCESAGERATLFFRLWTIKEAYLKYIGCGFAGRMDSFRPEPFPGTGQAQEPPCAKYMGRLRPGSLPGFLPGPDQAGAAQNAKSRGGSLQEPIPGSTPAYTEKNAENTGGFHPHTVLLSGKDRSEGSAENPGRAACRQCPGRILQLAALFSDESRVKEKYSRLSVQPKAESFPFPAAEYAALPAPKGYFMTVCARKIPGEIRMHRPVL